MNAFFSAVDSVILLGVGVAVAALSAPGIVDTMIVWNYELLLATGLLGVIGVFVVREVTGR